MHSYFIRQIHQRQYILEHKKITSYQKQLGDDLNFVEIPEHLIYFFMICPHDAHT